MLFSTEITLWKICNTFWMLSLLCLIRFSIYCTFKRFKISRYQVRMLMMHKDPHKISQRHQKKVNMYITTTWNISQHHHSRIFITRKKFTNPQTAKNLIYDDFFCLFHFWLLMEFLFHCIHSYGLYGNFWKCLTSQPSAECGNDETFRAFIRAYNEKC